MHPSNNHDHMPCFDFEKMKPNYDSQCCIRFGIALQRSGFDLSDYKGVTCWYGCDEIHCLRASEMSDFLKVKLGRPEVFKNCDENCIKGRQGIVFFENFWGPGNSLDHIDLFNGIEQTWGSNKYFSRSERVLFWEIE